MPDFAVLLKRYTGVTISNAHTCFHMVLDILSLPTIRQLGVNKCTSADAGVGPFGL